MLWTLDEFVLSHWLDSFCLQKWQSPHAIWKLATTLCPGLIFVTSGPTLSTIPQNSWPRISPFCNWIIAPWYRWRSEPQTVDPVTLRITSLGLTTLGLYVSTRIRLTIPEVTDVKWELAHLHVVFPHPGQCFHLFIRVGILLGVHRRVRNVTCECSILMSKDLLCYLCCGIHFGKSFNEVGRNNWGWNLLFGKDVAVIDILIFFFSPWYVVMTASDVTDQDGYDIVTLSRSLQAHWSGGC